MATLSLQREINTFENESTDVDSFQRGAFQSLAALSYAEQRYG